MATYEVKGPGGEVYHIDGPDNADPSAVIAQITGAHRFGTGKSFDALPNGQLAPSDSTQAIAARSPLSDSDFQNFRAAYGKGVVDLGRGAGQWLGLVNRQDVANSRALDAPLMNTKAGKAGAAIGTAATLLPTAFIPGANTLLGSAAIGAGTGALAPSASTGETLANIGLGAAAGPAGLLAGRGTAALYQGGKSLIEPLLQGGQERIAARTLQSFAGGPQAAGQAATALRSPPPVLPGVQPTTAELANNPGLAQLQRSLANNPESLTQITARQQANDAAVRQAVRGIAGTDAQMAAAQSARSSTSQPLYQAAGAATVPADAQLGQILARPSMRAAWDRAASLAAERGETLSEPNANDISGRTLQYLKMALQDTANSGPQRGMGSHELGAVRNTLGDLQSWITRNVPGLRAADTAYATASQPINQMQIGQQLADRLTPALTDFQTAPTRLNANAFAQTLRNGDQLAADVTGNARATLQGTLTPTQNQTLQQVGEQLGRRAQAADLGRAVGSNTTQNLASQNLMRQFLGPLGLPQSLQERAAQSALGQAIGRPAKWIGGVGEPRILQRLTDAALDPQQAARLLELSQRNPALARALWQRQGLLGSLASSQAPQVSGLLGLGNAPQQ